MKALNGACKRIESKLGSFKKFQKSSSFNAERNLTILGKDENIPVEGVIPMEDFVVLDGSREG